MRDTITHHKTEITCIEALIAERESTEEESSSSEDGPTPGSGSGDPPAQQEQEQEQDDVEMEDVEDASNPPQGMATQTDPTPKEVDEDTGAVGQVDSVTPVGERIVLEGGGTTPITPADD